MDPTNQNELLVAFARVEGKIDLLNQNIAAHSRDLEDHEDRIRGLEKKIWKLPSAAIVISVAMLVVSIFALPALNHNTPTPTPTVTVTSSR